MDEQNCSLDEAVKLSHQFVDCSDSKRRKGGNEGGEFNFSFLTLAPNLCMITILCFHFQIGKDFLERNYVHFQAPFRHDRDRQFLISV